MNRWIPALAALAITTTALAAPASGDTHVAAAGVPSGASAYTPNVPCRLLDTREESGVRLDAQTYRITIGDRCGAPSDLSAAVLTITATEASGAGHVTAYPAATARPSVSTLNYAPGRTVANTAIVAVHDGAVDVYLHTPTDVVVDLDGTFRPVGGPVAAGRLITVEPTRLADTRRPDSFVGEQVKVRGSGDLVLPLPAGVPSDATGVAISVVSVDSDPGHVTVHPAGTPRPNASVLTTDPLDRTRATTVLAPVDEDGIVLNRFSVGDLVVDLWGWFTGPSAAVSDAGLFVPETPTRVWDSRVSADPLHHDGRLTRTVGPDDVAVVALNLTSVESTDAGHITVGAAGSPRPTTSSLNFRWSEPVAAATLARNTTAGVTFWAHGGTHVIVDRFGWFTGGAAAATAAPDANPMPTTDRRVLVVSDSSFAGIRWNGALSSLQGAQFDARLESCRRLIGVSCRGREGYSPRTALAELQTVTPGTVDVLVMATGYNDFASRFPEAFEAVMNEARRLAVPRVVWITYREPVGYHSPSGASNAATFAANNRILRLQLASARWPELSLLDWNAYSAAHPEWATYDGVHLTVAGARAAAEFISRALAAMDRRPCPAAIGGPVTAGGWCAPPI
ncbi:MAG: hypothetical protein KDB37_05395 [Ilumatobacter sp.]|nr:hypothetical protein [Ilumatobacter sp.]